MTAGTTRIGVPAVTLRTLVLPLLETVAVPLVKLGVKLAVLPAMMVVVLGVKPVEPGSGMAWNEAEFDESREVLPSRSVITTATVTVVLTVSPLGTATEQETVAPAAQVLPPPQEQVPVPLPPAVVLKVGGELITLLVVPVKTTVPWSATGVTVPRRLRNGAWLSMVSAVGEDTTFPAASVMVTRTLPTPSASAAVIESAILKVLLVASEVRATVPLSARLCPVASTSAKVAEAFVTGTATGIFTAAVKAVLRLPAVSGAPPPLEPAVRPNEVTENGRSTVVVAVAAAADPPAAPFPETVMV